MSSSAKAIDSYDFTASDTLFLDANIWLLLYGPQGPTDPRVATYSRAFRKILEAGSKVFVDVLIVSEFVNSYSHSEFRLKQQTRKYAEWKEFRGSAEFQYVAFAIADNVRRILKDCERISSGFETLDMEALLADYESARPDFNDQVIVEICKANGLTLVTHDGDFAGADVAVVTANRRLLP